MQAVPTVPTTIAHLTRLKKITAKEKITLLSNQPSSKVKYNLDPSYMNGYEIEPRILTSQLFRLFLLCPSLILPSRPSNFPAHYVNFKTPLYFLQLFVQSQLYFGYLLVSMNCFQILGW